MTVLPHRTRPLAFAQGELVLHFMYLLQSHYKVDFESILILLSINDATMRPFMLDDTFDHAILVRDEIPNEHRGTISRLMIADKTGLPRETVRRKCKQLIERGIVLESTEGHLQAAVLIVDPEIQRGLDEAHSAVLRYFDRVARFGIK